MKTLLKYPVMLFFFTTLAVITAANFLTPPKAESEMENRLLSQRPKLTVAGLLDSSKDGFAQRYEAYVNDQFVVRDGWITLKSMCEAALGKIENNGIVYGPDGQMFEKHTTLDRERFERNLSLVSDFAAMYPDLTVRAMLVPASYDILVDKVPVGLGNIESAPLIAGAYDRWAGEDIKGIDLAPALSARADEYLYYRTDHHWTTLGARLAYEEYARAAGFAPTMPDETLARTVEDFYGTSFSKSKLFSARPDLITWYDVAVDSVTVDGEAADGLYDLATFDERDKYAAFLRGNNGVTVIENAAAPARSILVIKDSYANCFVPFLTQDFSRVVVVDLRSMPQKLSELIAAEDFSEVLLLYSFNNLAVDANLPRLKY